MNRLHFRSGEDVQERFTDGCSLVLGRFVSMKPSMPGVFRIIFLRPSPKSGCATGTLLVRECDSHEADCPPISIEHRCPNGPWVSGNQPAH